MIISKEHKEGLVKDWKKRLKEKTNSPESSLETPNKKQNQDKEKSLSEMKKYVRIPNLRAVKRDKLTNYVVVIEFSKIKQFIKEVLEEIDKIDLRKDYYPRTPTYTIKVIKQIIKQKAGNKLT